jgi:hypothetical protein
MSRTIAPFPFRCEPEIKARLKVLAKENRRSMNSEINAILEEALNKKAPTGVTVEAVFTNSEGK